MVSCGWKAENVPIARHGITDTASRHAPCKTTGTCKYCPFGARYAAPNFLNDMLNWGNYPNLRVMDQCSVEEVLMVDRATARGVRCRDLRSGAEYSIGARTVVIAGGAIESPKLLLRSANDHWPQGVGNDRDLVGRYFVTHPYFIFSGTIPSNPQRLQTEMDFPTLCTRQFDSAEEQAKGKFILVVPPSATQSLVNGSAMTIAQMMQAGMGPAEIDAAVVGPAQVQIHGMLEIPSEYGNRVTNLDKRNRIGLWQTTVKYSKSRDFDQRMTEIGQTVHQLFAAMGATLSGPPSISWRADHAACTCRMAERPEDGVVDRDLKVFGVNNLYVCSNAVFPNTGAINPTLTLTALALRLGQHLNQTTAQMQGGE
jgi:choline dehydrogenase-like flavoprotein